MKKQNKVIKKYSQGKKPEWGKKIMEQGENQDYYVVRERKSNEKWKKNEYSQ